MRRRARLVAVACAVLLSGCYSFSTLGRARVVEPEHLEVFVAPSALIVATDTGAATRPIGEAGLRYGLTREVELGARLTSVGLTLGTRVQLYRSPDPSTGVDLLLAPALAYTAQDKLAIELPLLFGVNLGEHQLVFGPRITYQMRLGAPGTSAPINFLYLGTSVGVVFRLDDHVALVPEVSLLGQIYADPGFATNLTDAIGIQASLGLLIDP